jgi:hypothetical protein
MWSKFLNVYTSFWITLYISLLFSEHGNNIFRNNTLIRKGESNAENLKLLSIILISELESIANATILQISNAKKELEEKVL